jgi:hypothetical protein
VRPFPIDIAKPIHWNVISTVIYIPARYHTAEFWYSFHPHLISTHFTIGASPELVVVDDNFG